VYARITPANKRRNYSSLENETKMQIKRMQSCGGWLRKEGPRRAVKANSRRATKRIQPRQEHQQGTRRKSQGLCVIFLKLF